jgi:hypothetical protein
MADFGTTPRDSDGIPLSSVYQEDNALLVIRGIRPHTDGFTRTTVIPEVGAASGDFAAGSIVDLATLLTLAGTSADANTVASIFGRLTKIRDLLAATLTISGTVTEANSASILTDLAILAGAVSSGKVLTTETNSGSIKSDLDTLAGIVSSSKAAVKSAAGDIVDLATLAGIVSSSKAAVKAGAGDFADLATIAGAISSSKMQATIAAIAASLSQSNQVPVSNAAPQTPLTLTVTSNSGTFTNNLDNTITFSGGASVARRIRIQNESSGTIYWATDATASTGSPSLVAPPSNGVSVEWIAVQCTTLHIWVPSGGTTTLNGTGGVKVTAYA